MYTRMPIQNVDLQATRSSMGYTVPMVPQEPNLNFLLMMMQMLSHMKRFQYQPISTPNLQQPVELDIQSIILRSQQGHSVMEELAKSQVPHEETREKGIYEVLPSEEVEEEQNIQKTSQNFDERDLLLKETKRVLEDMVAENKRINNELKISKEELEKCRKNKEEEIKCNSIDNLHQVPVSDLAGWHVVGLNQGFRPGSKIVIRGRTQNELDRLNFNFKYPEGQALHVDNRWNFLDSKDKLIMNSYINGSWGQEVIVESAPIARGSDFIFTVQSEKEEFKICVNGSPFATYSHKVDPKLITTVDISGAAEITSVYYQGIEEKEQESSIHDDSFPLDEEQLDDLIYFFGG